MKTMLQVSGSFQETRQYLQHLSHAALVVDSTGIIREVNEALLRVTGFTREEMIGAEYDRLFPNKRTMGQLLEQASVLSNEIKEVLCEIEWQNQAGEIGRTQACIVVQQRPETMFLIHLFQLTEVRHASLLLRFAEQLSEESHLGLILIDADANIIEISNFACKVLGLNRSHVLNRSIEQAFAGVSEEHRVIHRDLLQGVKVQNQAISWTNENMRYELIVDSHPIQDETGKIVGGYVLFKDVTNLRSIHQKIERSDRLAMIGQIAAGTAHEIRNPLTSIKGFLQMFMQSFAEKGLERERAYAEIMLTEINRINSLVSEFLLLSKPRDVQYKLVDLNVVFEEILPIVESQALYHGIDVAFPSRYQLPMVVGDAELLKQVFLNICKNGIEAMGNEGVLTISHHVDLEENKMSIDIHDTGPGIPPYVIDKIFDPFFTTKEEGTGLGLAVCQKIIHDIGGQIRVSSKGFGTTFHILLPYL